jgi:signal recognition particle subunit SRP14
MRTRALADLAIGECATNTGALSHDEFFEKLGFLFDHRKGRDHGAIYLSQKRFPSAQSDADTSNEGSFPGSQTTSPLPLIIRATNGKSKRSSQSKVKLSTVVEPHELESFYLRYADICKAGMAAMKPRDRSKKKAKAKKKKTAA